MENLFGGRKIMVSAVVGSHNYNLNTPSSDVDWKYFVAPTFDDLYQGAVFSDASQSETKDYSAHDIRQLSNLIWKANPAFVEVLYSRNITHDPILGGVFKSRDVFATMNMPAFLNSAYGMHQQKMRELHKGTAKTDVLIERFGYDTKQALHALRLLYVLSKFVETRDMGKALWFEDSDPVRDTLLDLKAGIFSEVEFLSMVRDWHLKNWANVQKVFWNEYTPDLGFKAVLDDFIKSIVKDNLK